VDDLFPDRRRRTKEDQVSRTHTPGPIAGLSLACLSSPPSSPSAKNFPIDGFI
jgi:hypothetical protein